MRILFLTQVLSYPLDAGPKVRAYYVLRHLAARHEVTLVSFVRATDRPAAVEHMAGFCRAVHTLTMPRSRARDAAALLKTLANGQPFLIARDWVPGMARLIGTLVEQNVFDAVHADQLWMAPYARYAAQQAAARGRTLMTVLDQHNAVCQIPRRMADGTGNSLKGWLLALEAKKLLRYELETCRHFDYVAWVTGEDRAIMQPPVDAAKPWPVIPICVDPAARSPLAPAGQPRRVTFLGGLHWPPNAEGILWFAREVWPQVLAQAPDALLTVIGKDPPAALGHGPGLDVTGYVADPAPYLAETAAFIVPLHAGGGMRVKILDAWAWGLPVVSTTIGAEGLAYRNGQELLIADSAQAFGVAVVSLLGEPELARRIAAEGRRTLEAGYDWRKIYPAWDTVYDRKNADGKLRQ